MPMQWPENVESIKQDEKKEAEQDAELVDSWIFASLGDNHEELKKTGTGDDGNKDSEYEVTKDRGDDIT